MTCISIFLGPYLSAPLFLVIFFGMNFLSVQLDLYDFKLSKKQEYYVLSVLIIICLSTLFI